ncbi:class D sortase [Caldifermentibacillus hisashii]|uniref:class D sortase n=1 Tax=Caldifermentibacillus hisashii TaxID=996558 RepID=UPI0033671C15
MKRIGNILIIIGIMFIVFVAYTKLKTYSEQQKLFKEYTSLNFIEEENEETLEGDDLEEAKNGSVIGILEIPKIDLKTPIVEGAGEENIKYAVGHLPSSSSVGNIGKKNENFAIVGHRSYTYGKFFNRLDELEKGNKIIIKVRNEELTYKVFDKKIVKPTDVDVVKPVKGKSMVTLITCHPPYSNESRLIIFSELASQKVLE